MKKLFILLIIVLPLQSGCSDGSSKGVFVPLENLSYPVDSAELTDAAQINEELFIIGSGTVYGTNLVTGESREVCSTDCTLINAYDDVLHLFDPTI